MKESIIKNKSFEFALRIKSLQSKNEFVLPKQILKSGTSVKTTQSNIKEETQHSKPKTKN